MTSGTQLVFDLPLRQAFGREDFLVTESNRGAVALIDQWPDWSTQGAIIVGPPGSGKSHLAEVFRNRAQAKAVLAAELKQDVLPDLAMARAAAVEDVQAGGFDETAMFHLFNLAQQNRMHLLLTSRTAPSRWDVKLPDLRTRLATLAVVPMLLPDDELLRAVLLKHFHDRQLAIGETVISYLLPRMPRSLDAARALAAEIDRRALVQRVEITRSFVSDVVRDFVNPLFSQMDVDPS